MEKRRLALLTTVHFFNDSYASFLPPLLPLLILRMDISITSETFLVSVFTFSSSITQPVFGYLADLVTRRYFVVLGPAVAVTFMSYIGVAPSYTVLAVLSFLTIAAFLFALFLPGRDGVAAAVRERRE